MTGGQFLFPFAFFLRRLVSCEQKKGVDFWLEPLHFANSAISYRCPNPAFPIEGNFSRCYGWFGRGQVRGCFVWERLLRHLGGYLVFLLYISRGFDFTKKSLWCFCQFYGKKKKRKSKGLHFQFSSCFIPSIFGAVVSV